jgi:hypothetical protein
MLGGRGGGGNELGLGGGRLRTRPPSGGEVLLRR